MDADEEWCNVENEQDTLKQSATLQHLRGSGKVTFVTPDGLMINLPAELCSSLNVFTPVQA